VVLGDLLRENGLLPQMPARCTVFIAAFDDAGFDLIIPLAGQLRQAGISCEFPFRRTNIAKQLKLADAAGAAFVLIAGGEESARGLVTIKRMCTGESSTIATDRVTDEIKRLVSTL
jgi:histidyl-tRNA synthetase